MNNCLLVTELLQVYAWKLQASSKCENKISKHIVNVQIAEYIDSLTISEYLKFTQKTILFN